MQEPANAINYFTESKELTEISVVEELGAKMVGAAKVCVGKVRVSAKVRVRPKLRRVPIHPSAVASRCHSPNEVTVLPCVRVCVRARGCACAVRTRSLAM